MYGSLERQIWSKVFGNLWRVEIRNKNCGQVVVVEKLLGELDTDLSSATFGENLLGLGRDCGTKRA